MADAYINELISFIRKSPTSFHAVETVKEELQGFTELKECEKWQLVPGGRYFVTRNRSSIIAFVLPKGEPRTFQLVASHSDSSTFKIKENAELTAANRYVQLDVERYGGMILSSWFDRPLSVAGRVVIKTEKGIATRLVDLDRDLVLIPNIAIHMNREINNGYKYDPSVDTMPLFGEMAAKGMLRQQLAQACGVKEEEILGSDLYLYNRMEGTVWGAQQEFVSAPRLDDLECVFSSVQALRLASPGEHINVCCVFDNEEVGSGTKQGADSSFLMDVLRRIVRAFGKGEEDLQAMLAQSFMLSADNAHATHPNKPGIADPVNRVFMNEGIVIKFNANQKYTTDGVSEAVFHHICTKAGVPVQHFANRSDMAGGSTLGNISGSHVSVNTLDIGLAQLAMHSCYETAGVKDVAYMVEGMRAFYEAEITSAGDGEYCL